MTVAAERQREAPGLDQYWLFWDGECGFCRRGVAWLKSRDHRNLILPTPYQQAPDPPMDEQLSAACARAVHLLHPDGRLERAARACITALALAGFPRLARGLRWFPLVWLVEAGYWLVARHRALFSRLLFRVVQENSNGF